MAGIGIVAAVVLLPWSDKPVDGFFGVQPAPWSQAGTDVWNALQRPLYGLGRPRAGLCSGCFGSCLG